MNVSQCIALANSEINVSSTVSLILCLVTSTICAFSVISNVTIFIALVRSVYTCNGRQTIDKTRSTVTKLIFISYVSVDIIVAVFLMPMSILEVVNKGRWTLGSYMCRAKYFASNIICYLSIIHILTMAVDRYLAVCHPLVYRLFTSRQGYILIALSWICSVILVVLIQISWSQSCYEVGETCFVIYDRNVFVIQFILTNIFPFVTVVVLYVLILKDVRRFHQRTSKYKRNSHPEQTLNDSTANTYVNSFAETPNTNNAIEPDADNSLNKPSINTIDAPKTAVSVIAFSNNNGTRTSNLQSDVNKNKNPNIKAYRNVGCDKDASNVKETLQGIIDKMPTLVQAVESSKENYSTFNTKLIELSDKMSTLQENRDLQDENTETKYNTRFNEIMAEVQTASDSIQAKNESCF
ncbi:hypothetical protein Btru_063704 [Bulinus truncatus]|nr:hypothetical protein Btru_063704 [Bulinus truncatus]